MPITLLCHECGEPYETKPVHVKRSRYCSKRCMYHGRAKPRPVVTKPGEIAVLGSATPATVDEVDADLSERSWYLQQGYALTRYPTGIRQMHRVVLERALGRPLAPGEFTDHVDRNRLNNRRGNLRVASKRQNNTNRPKRSGSASQYKGVLKAQKPGRWMACIDVDGVYVHLGTHSSEEDAAYIYDQFAMVLHGEFAYLNLL